MKGLCWEPVRVSWPEPPERTEAALDISFAPFPLCTREQMPLSSSFSKYQREENRWHLLCHTPQPASFCPVKCSTSAAHLHPSASLFPFPSPMLREKQGSRYVSPASTLPLCVRREKRRGKKKRTWSSSKHLSLWLRVKSCSEFCSPLSTTS